MSSSPRNASTPVDIGQEVQLFFDLEHVQMLQDVTQTMHAPARHPANPLIRGDRRWEDLLYFAFSSGNVLYSADENLFRVWYEDLSFDHQRFKTDADPFPWNHMALHYLYAESKDGVLWEKPPLGLIADWGPATNVVFGDRGYKVHVLTVLDDPRAQAAAHRFKGLYVHPTVARGRGHEIALASSPDGLRWTPSSTLPHFEGASQQLGDVLILSYDETLGRYVLMCRHPAMHGPPPPPSTPGTRSFLRPLFPGDPPRESRRRIFRAESDDLLHWSEPAQVYCPDDEDNWDDTFYGMVQFRRGPLLIGLMVVLHAVENSYDVQLAYSRDGWHWKRVGQRRPFLGYGPDGAWDRWCINVSSQPIIRDGQMWLYYGGAINHHDYWLAPDHALIDLPEVRDLRYVDHGLGLARIRLDGFVSASAYVREALLITRPARSDGTRMEVNVACRNGGWLAMELTDAHDEVLPGYARADCDVFAGDSVAHTVTWRGHRTLPDARAGLKLRFFFKQADLFSFRFAV